MKQTTRQISYTVSGTLTFLSFLLCLFFKFFFDIDYYVLFIFPLFIFLFSFSLFNFFAKKFIYDKIKLIFKIIYDTSDSKENKQIALKAQKDFIENATTNVLAWLKTKQEETKRLKRLEQYRKEFLSNVSHELKTPIFNIQGFIETVIDDGMRNKAIALDYLKRAAKNIDRLNAIINDLEIISRIETDQIPIEYTDFSINNLVDEVLSVLASKASLFNIKLNTKASSDYMVRADQEKIRQVLNNLIENSIKYGRQNGQTTVSLSELKDQVLISIADNGIGIGEAHLPRLFERFYRVDKDRSRAHGGTGLGLAIVKHILEAHSKTAEVKSKIGEGSTFSFILD